jgi:CubicO group peptidase (beta-lactamase class C family)
MNNYWLASNNNVIVPLRDSMKVINGLRPVKPSRGQFQYNNLGYEIAAHVIREVSGSSWDEMLHTRLFKPLQMTRTGTHGGFAGAENVARCYNALSDATPILIGQGRIGDDTIASAAGGVRSTLNDMLKLAQAWTKAAEHQFRERTTTTPGSPLPQVLSILSNHISVRTSSNHENSYAFGFVRSQLRGPLGEIGSNLPWMTGSPGDAQGHPLVGKDIPCLLVLYHQGSAPEALCN